MLNNLVKIFNKPQQLRVFVEILILSGVFLFSVPSVQARSANHWAVSVGRISPNRIDAGADEFSFNRGEAYTLTWGGQVDALRVEYRLSGTRVSVRNLHDTSSTTTVSGQLKTHTLSLNFYERRHLPFIPDKIRGFWSLGFGISRVELSNLRTSTRQLFDDVDYSLYYSGRVGLEYELNDSSFISVTGNLDSTATLDFDNHAGESVSFGRLSTQTISIEYRWLY